MDTQLNELIQKATSGDVEAMYQVGHAYENETDIVSFEKSVKWYTEAQNNGHKLAKVRLFFAKSKLKKKLDSLINLTQSGDQSALSEYFVYQSYKAEEGSSESQLFVGRSLMNGTGCAKDETSGYQWLCKALSNGSLEAASLLNEMGLNFQNGNNGYPQDGKMAFNCYKSASASGDKIPMSNLAFCYFNGIGTDKDYDLAINWWRKAAEAGDAVSMGNLGSCYQLGSGVEKDFDLAFEWYVKSIQANPNSEWTANKLNEIGLNWQNAQNGFPNENEKAFRCFLEAAKVGNAKAMTNVANCYINAIGVAKDYQQAFYWGSKSAEKNDASAMRYLGWLYENGNGVEKDVVKAISWYKKAVAAGDDSSAESIKALRNQCPSIETLIEAVASGETDSLEIIDDITELPDLSSCRNNLRSIIIPGSIKAIPHNCFNRFERLEEVIINDGVTNIGERAFNCCTNLVSVCIPNSVSCIEDYAFFACESLKSIVVPPSVKTIGKSAFSSCPLSQLTLNEGLETIGEEAFKGIQMDVVTIPSSVKTIDYIGNIIVEFKGNTLINARNAICIVPSTIESFPCVESEGIEYFTHDQYDILLMELEDTKQKAINGDAEAQFELAVCYEKGIFPSEWEVVDDEDDYVPFIHNKKKTAYWMQKAADQNYANALYWVAFQNREHFSSDTLTPYGEKDLLIKILNLYRKGHAISYNKKRIPGYGYHGFAYSDYIYEKTAEMLADLGKAFITRSIKIIPERDGIRYYISYGPNSDWEDLVDYEAGISCVRIAIEHNFGQANMILGYCYEHGLGVAENLSMALSYYDKVSTDDAWSYDYSSSFFNAKNKKEYKDYVELLRDKCKNPEKYKRLQEEAEAKQKEAEAKQKLEDFRNQTVQKANAGDTNAMCQLGMWLEHGENGIEQDKQKALKMYQAAMVAGNSSASTLYDCLHRELLQEQEQLQREQLQEREQLLREREERRRKKENVVRVRIDYMVNGVKKYETGKMSRDEYMALAMGGQRSLCSFIRNNCCNYYGSEITDASISIEHE